MSEAKEGKLFGRKKLLDPLLGTTEGTKITSTIIFYTSHALTVYSNAPSQTGHLRRHVKTLKNVTSVTMHPLE